MSGRYRLGDEIGRGALGRVVRLHDDSSGEVFAAKILHASHRENARAASRFDGEARIAAELTHPNVVRVFGVEEVGSERVLRMELVDGPSLAVLLAREGALAAARLAAIGRGIAAGLGAAHRAGLIHRDLKAENVLIAEGDVPKIVDFGLARATSFAGVDRDAFAVVGTPETMAPESIDPLAVDARSDLYSLGCVLYQMTSGEPPFSGPTAFAVLEAHRDQPVPALAETQERPAALIELICWLLAKSPADRPQSADLVERALADLAGSHALVVAGSRGLSTAAGRCAACGEVSISGVAVCFGCGASHVLLEPGGHSVFVVGPGERTNKIDSAARQRLIDWLRANPAVGLDPTPLTKHVPRLPFVVATEVSAESGEALSRALGALGFECEVVEGGRFALPEMRKKAWSLSGRIGAAVLMSGLWTLNQLFQHFHPLVFFPAVAAGAGISAIAGWRAAGRGVATRALGGGSQPLALSESLSRVTAVVPAIAERRHRESLRGVVQRALGCRELLVARGGAQAEADLAQLIDLATLAASRVDQLEAELAACDVREPSEAERRKIIERDVWAARLLGASAFLDALRARYAAAAGAPEGDALLAELRTEIESLEEVQAL